MSETQKILIISDAWEPQTNGVVRTYQELSKNFKGRGKDVKIIGPSDFSWTIPMPGYPEIRLAILPYRQMKKYIKGLTPDRIHIATEGPLGWAGRRYCIRHNIPFTSCYHTKFDAYIALRVPRFLRGGVHKLCVQFIRRFHAPSAVIMTATQTIEDVLRSYGVTNKISRLTRGVDPSIFYLGQKTEFQDYTTPIALYVGRVSPEKNLTAFLDMPWQGSKVIVGDGPQRKALQRQYPKAYFFGKKTGVALGDCYRAADVFVFPSKTDTFGMVLVEAMACGLPSAAYPVMGPKDIIDDDRLGCLNADLALAAMTALTSGTAEGRHKHAIQTYRWHKACDQFLDAV